MLATTVGVAAGRLARWATRLRGGGSAFPGRLLLAIDPSFLKRAAASLPLGVVFVSGSNGKSTTTTMLASVLRAHGLRVFSNPAGGNMPQGVASAMLADVPLNGVLDADIAVIEVDEAYGQRLAPQLTPHSVLLVNVQVDQLNRFYEPDRVVGMLEAFAAKAQRNLVVNGDDHNLVALASRAAGDGSPASQTTFAVTPELLEGGPAWLARGDNPSLAASDADAAGRAAVLVTAFADRTATLRVQAAGPAAGESFDVTLPARGLHYAVDAAAASAMALALLGDDFAPASVQSGLAGMATVYGRGEVLEVRGERIEVLMMKNPPSLQVNLDYLDPDPEQVFVAVDEGTPDPSWIYASDLSRIGHVDVLTGTKSWQLATRFGYAGIEVREVVEELQPALQRFLAMPPPSRGMKTMIVNYEQMMSLRKILGFLELEGKRA